MYYNGYQPDDKTSKTIFINRFDSRCGNCNKSADYSEDRHEHVLGYSPGIGCMEKWEYVSSDYMGMNESVAACRPDLEAYFFDDVQS